MASKASTQKPSQDLYNFNTRFLNVNGNIMHTVDHGTGTPVVMIHGNPTWSFYYRNLIKALPAGFRAIAPDHIGCGLSDKPSPRRYDYRLKSRVDDLTALLDQLNINEPVHLVVHDWGGMIGVLYALKNLDKIASITVTNTSGFLPPGGKNLPIRLACARYAAWFAKPAILGGNLFARSAIWMASKKGLPEPVAQGLLSPYNSPANRMATYKFVMDIPLSPKDPSFDLVSFADQNLSKLSQIPMMILWGKHDFVFDMDYYNEWTRRFPEVPSTVYNDAGHYLMEDEKDTVPGKIAAFIASQKTGETV